MVKIYKLIFTSNEKNKIKLFFLLVLFSTFLETISVASVIPIIYSLIDYELFNNFLLVKNIFINHSPLKFFIDTKAYTEKNLFIFTGLILVIFFFLFKSLYLTYANYFQIKFINKLNLRWSTELYNIYLKQSYNFHVKTNSAYLIRNIYEAQTCSSTVQSFLTLTLDLLILISITLLILIISPVTSFILIIFLSVVSFLYYFFTKKYVYSLGVKRHKSDGLVQKFMQEGLKGFKLIKIMNKINFFQDSFFINKSNSIFAVIKNEFIKSIPKIYLELIIVVIICLIIIYAILNNYEINSIISIIALYGAAAFKIIPSLNRIISNLQKIKFDLPSFNNLYVQLKSIKKNKITKLDKKKEIYFSKNIKFQNLSFGYLKNKNNLILDKIDLEIFKGEIIGITGESGSGKSTILNLFLGLLEKDNGKILVDNKIIKSQLFLKNIIGYMPQEIFIVDDTIERNITLDYSKPIDTKELHKVLKDVNLYDLVNNLPKKIKTKVGENGLRLSGGQRQRLGLARALYNNPSILVFDEATNSLDAETERDIFKMIKNFRTQKTILIVSHNFKIIEEICDKIYKIENKKITKIK